MDKDWFALLGLDATFDLDLDTLERHYRKAQWAAHPDRYAHAQPLSAAVNAAYIALKNPLERAACLLKHFGFWPVPPDTAVLEEIFARQAAGETRCADTLKEGYAQLAQHFADKDYAAAQKVYLRLCYLEKL